MTLKISLALGFLEHHEQPHKHPSLLAREEDYLDDHDDGDWDEHVKPRRRSSSVEVALNSCVTSLSSSLNSARSALATHAKKLYSRNSPRRGSHLRNSMIEIPSTDAARSLARANSMPAPSRSSESDLDLFAGVEDGLETVDLAEACLPKVDAPSRVSTHGQSRFARLLQTRSWTQGSKREDK
ncbi:hypothetical protein PHYPSEUDO_010789 [Phytophthora pseudosyringae]|uniref:Uncharacterized protein n=1 Tax=Phytophthora pseudosyringae TaxID=221518 RepID=A0A8T1W7G7_9STRA|nr:hypothetical protein PHYPSEUDO_010789 [Phytophthora pseudosyringae]